MKNIPITHDKRIKISPEQRQEIKDLYKTGDYSQRQLASIYGVSRRLIVLYIDDTKMTKHKEKEKTKNYYDKEKNKIYQKRYRHRRKDLMMKGLLT